MSSEHYAKRHVGTKPKENAEVPTLPPFPRVVAWRDCVCSDPEPHFCPPCFGEDGFFACNPDEFPPKG